jgi:hypothetical protein
MQSVLPSGVELGSLRPRRLQTAPLVWRAPNVDICYCYNTVIYCPQLGSTWKIQFVADAMIPDIMYSMWL